MDHDGEMGEDPDVGYSDDDQYHGGMAAFSPLAHGTSMFDDHAYAAEDYFATQQVISSTKNYCI